MIDYKTSMITDEVPHEGVVVEGSRANIPSDYEHLSFQLFFQLSLESLVLRRKRQPKVSWAP